MYRISMPIGMLALALMPILHSAHAQTPATTHVSSTVDNNPSRFDQSGSDVSSSQTAPVNTLTLQQALALALAANPDLSAARHEAAAVAATIRQAGLLPNPEISMSVEDRRRETRTTAFEISQPIELGGKRAARVAAANRAHDTAEIDLISKNAEVRAAVITSFFNVLHAQERLRLAEMALSIAKNGSNAAGRRVMAGKVSPVEETRARIAEAGVRLEANQAASDLATTRRKLAAHWNSTAPQFTQVNGDAHRLPDLPAWNVIETRLQDAPGMMRARAEVLRWQAVTELEKAKRTPNVSISLGMQRNNETGRDQALFGVSIPIPVFDRNQGNLLEALRRTDKARDEAQAMIIRLDTDLAQAYEMLRNARQQADTLQREILPGAQSAYDAAVKGFEFGKFDFMDVLDAQRTLLQTRSQHLRALSEAHAAAAEIDRLLGVSLDTPSNISQ